MFKPATGGNIFFNFLKAKNEEQLKNKSIFYCSDQKQFCPFWGHEIFLIFFVIQIFSLAIVHCSKRKAIANFL